MNQEITTKKGKTSQGFSDEERAVMKERARELKAEARASKDREAGERDVLAKIAEMPEADRLMGERIHALIKASAHPSRRRPGTGCPRKPTRMASFEWFGL